LETGDATGEWADRVPPTACPTAAVERSTRVAEKEKRATAAAEEPERRGRSNKSQ